MHSFYPQPPPYCPPSYHPPLPVGTLLPSFLLPLPAVPCFPAAASGFAFSANNVPSPDPEDIFGNSFMDGHRAQRIRQMLEDLRRRPGPVTVEDFQRSQLDTFSFNGAQFRDVVLMYMCMCMHLRDYVLMGRDSLRVSADAEEK
eukprot:GHVU01105996.1.p3 GENE.GHVU01105996.1~~GHVU01105996.1.p3  ORF type:complete len:144 (+),score=24.16 GHVU01105996.1:403-834(+)